MEINNFNYDVDKTLIAQHPIKNRTESKLLYFNKNKIEHKSFFELIDILQKDDVLVLNNTKVLKNKLIGIKETGSSVKIIILKKINDLYLSKVNTNKIQLNIKLLFPNNLEGEIIERREDEFLLKFNKDPIPTLNKFGEYPLPPYIKKKVKNQESYQTSYAKINGSFAAPTAGLHFNQTLLDKLKDKGVIIVYLTLHVSFGTFLPILTNKITDHKMHKEYYSISQKCAEQINNRKGRLIVVGTTTLRALESSSKNNIIKPQQKYTELFIYPGYKFNLNYDALITNFHLPKSSLFILVSAFVGLNNLKKIYSEATKNKYKFYSFGDSSILFRNH